MAITAAALLVDSSPLRLAVYYGIPSLVNGAAGDVARAARVFAEYDVVVFGDGLEFDDVVAARTPRGNGAIEYRRTMDVIRLLSASPRGTRVFGYIDLGRSQQLSLDEIRQRTLRWKAMGAAGIFFDEAGADFGVDRTRQNAAIDAAHAAGMAVALNAFDPDDAFRPSADGTRTRLRRGDAYLLESFAVRNGRADNSSLFRDRLARARRAAADAGVALWATTTGEGQFDVALMDLAWRAAIDASVDAFAWGEPSFSSTDSQLPFRPRPR